MGSWDVSPRGLYRNPLVPYLPLRKGNLWYVWVVKVQICLHSLTLKVLSKICSRRNSNSEVVHLDFGFAYPKDPFTGRDTHIFIIPTPYLYHILRNLIGWEKSLKLHLSLGKESVGSIFLRFLKTMTVVATFVIFWWQSWNYKEQIIIFVDFIEL